MKLLQCRGSHILISVSSFVLYIHSLCVACVCKRGGIDTVMAYSKTLKLRVTVFCNKFLSCFAKKTVSQNVMVKLLPEYHTAPKFGINISLPTLHPPSSFYNTGNSCCCVQRERYYDPRATPFPYQVTQSSSMAPTF